MILNQTHSFTVKRRHRRVTAEETKPVSKQRETKRSQKRRKRRQRRRQRQRRRWRSHRRRIKKPKEEFIIFY